MDVAVEKEKLALAIGKGGQNIRLASEVTGWKLNIMDAEEAEEKSQKELDETIALFIEQLDVDEDIAKILAEEGFTTIEEVAYIPDDEMCEISVFDEDIVAALKERAQDALLTSAIAMEEEIGDVLQLHELESITDEDITKLNENEIIIAEDLAELSVDEMVELGFDAKWATKMILEARKPWFEAENESEQG
jgi:N utilization substance protein A